MAQDAKWVGPAGPAECKVCGAEFECRGAGCWCATVRVNPGRREHIALLATGCVCPDCLTGEGRSPRSSTRP